MFSYFSKEGFLVCSSGWPCRLAGGEVSVLRNKLKYINIFGTEQKVQSKTIQSQTLVDLVIWLMPLQPTGSTARITPCVKRTIFFSTLNPQTPLVRALKLEIMFWCTKFYWELLNMFSILTAFQHKKDVFLGLPDYFCFAWSHVFPLHLTRAFLALSETAPETLLPRIGKMKINED